MQNKVILPAELDFSCISYGKPRVTAGKATMYNIVYSKNAAKDPMFNTNLVIQTPMMYVPFDINTFDNASGDGAQNKSICMSFQNADVNPDIGNFLSIMKALDEKIKSDAVDHKFHDPKTKLDPSIVDILYTPILKQKGDYPANMKVKLPVGQNGEFTFGTYVKDPVTQQPNRVNLSTLTTRGCRCKALIWASMVYMVNNKNFGVSFRMVQLEVVPPPVAPEYAFVSSGVEYDAANEKDLSSESEEGDMTDRKRVAEHLASDDEEILEEEEEEEAETVPPLSRAVNNKKNKAN